MPGDYDGDPARPDEAVFDPASATYYIRYSGGGSKIQQFGIPNGQNQFVAGDFDGDGKTDEAVFDPVTATYYIRYSSGGSKIQQFGIANGKNEMVPGDFDGDGKTDECIFDPVTATYYIRYSNPAFNGGSRIQQFGIPNGQNQFVAGDFDGDGKTDEAVFDPVSATYYIRYSNPSFNGGSRIQQFGIPNANNMMVPGDFDGDGKTDETVFDPTTATYYIRYSNPNYNGGSRVLQFGIANGQNMMVPGDFDGDGKTDEAVYDPVTSTYYIRYSNPSFNGGSKIQQFGVANGLGMMAPALTGVRSTGGQKTTLLSTGGPSDFSPLATAIAPPTGPLSLIAKGHRKQVHDGSVKPVRLGGNRESGRVPRATAARRLLRSGGPVALSRVVRGLPAPPFGAHDAARHTYPHRGPEPGRDRPVRRPRSGPEGNARPEGHGEEGRPVPHARHDRAARSQARRPHPQGRPRRANRRGVRLVRGAGLDLRGGIPALLRRPEEYRLPVDRERRHHRVPQAQRLHRQGAPRRRARLQRTDAEPDAPARADAARRPPRRQARQQPRIHHDRRQVRGQALQQPERRGVYDSKGNLYFTDPPYGLLKLNDDPAKELDFNGVYRVSTDGKLSLLDEGDDLPERDRPVSP